MYGVSCLLLHLCLRNGTAFRLLYFEAYELLVVLGGRVDIRSLENAPHSDVIIQIFIS
jgi:1-acyl-sn-glycerol-3-phosphate acyltransferase